MRMKEQITNGMFVAIIINLVYPKAIGFTQGIMAREIGGDIWLATLLAVLQGILIMVLTVWVIKRIPEKNLLQQTEILVGKWLGKLVGLSLFIFLLGAFTTIMITLIHHLRDFFLPDIPLLLFVGLSMIIIIYSVYHGLEVIARMSILGVFSVLALNILIALGSFSDFDVRELIPLFQNGVLETVQSSRHHDTDWAMATIIAAILLPSVKSQKEWSKAGVAGIVFGGASVLLWPILEAGVLSPEVTAQYSVSCMQLARSAQIGQFLHRYEMIMVAFFVVSTLTGMMVTLLSGSIITANVFGLKDYRQAVVPVAIIFGVISYFIVFDHTRSMDFATNYWPPVALSIAIGLPIFVGILGLIFKQKLKKIRQSN